MIRRAYIRLGRVRSAVKFLGCEQDAVRPARYALLRARVVRVSAPVKFVGWLEAYFMLCPRPCDRELGWLLDTNDIYGEVYSQHP